jgi:hypothetical protein
VTLVKELGAQGAQEVTSPPGIAEAVPIGHGVQDVPETLEYLPRGQHVPQPGEEKLLPVGHAMQLSKVLFKEEGLYLPCNEKKKGEGSVCKEVKETELGKELRRGAKGGLHALLSKVLANESPLGRRLQLGMQ